MRAGLLSGIIVLFFFSTSQAQVTSEADFKKKFGLVDGYLYDGDYFKALPLAKELYAYDTTNANVNYMLGTCYLGADPDRKKAIYHLEQSVMLSTPSPMYKEGDYKEKTAPGVAYYNLARAYHFVYRFDDAISNYYNYRSFIDLNDVVEYAQVKHQIEYSENAKLLIEEPVNIKVQSLGPVVNSKYEDYSPVISADGNTLIFTSRREGTTGGKLFLDGKFYEDIYIAKKERGKWTTPRSIGANINTEGHEATIGLSPDGQQLFIYKDDNGDGNIYMSKLSGSEWSKPEKLGGEINTSSWETHATVSADGQNLFFVSNRNGGIGGRDIYKVSLLPDGTWGKAENLGPTINTQYDEEAPFFAADGITLIFSSQGHNSMGGFDIFTSENIDGVWSTPVNIGYPINSPEDDVFFVTTPDGQFAYYSSRMEGGMGEKDIYLIELSEKKKESLTVMKGVIILENTSEINANIVVSDARTKTVTGIYKPHKQTGSYIFILQPGTEYNVSYECDGYETRTDKIVVPENSSYAEITRAVLLDPVVCGKGEVPLVVQNEQPKEEEKIKVEEKEDPKVAELKALEAQLLAEEKALKERQLEEARLAEEKRKAEDAAKVKAEEEAKLAVEKKKAEELEAAKAAEEKKLAEEAAAKAKAEEANRLAEENRKAAEAAKAKAEEEAKLAAEKKKAEELAAAKSAEEKKLAEEAAAKAKADEEAKLAVEKKKAEELAAAKAAEEKKLAEETAAKAKAAEEARLAEEKRKAEEAEKLAAEKKRAEELAAAKAEQEKKQAEEAARIAEEKRKAEEIAKAKAAEEAKLAAEKKIADELTAQKKKAFEDSLVARKNEIVKRLEELKKLQAQKSTETAEETKAELAKAAADKKREEEKLAAEAKLAEDKRAAEEAAQKAKAEEQRKLAEKAAEEKRKTEEAAAKQKAEAEAKAQAEALANAKSIDELKKMNQALIAENELLKKQIAEGNKKIDQLTNQVEQQNKNYQELLAKFDEMQKQQKYQNAVQKTDFESFKKGESVVLKNIFFDYNLSIIRKESEEELQKLLAYMRENKGVKVEVSGHTDSHGNNEYNIELSRDRANSVVRYLTSRGIEASRLKSVGMGETQPIAINENPDGSDNPEGRQLNRRIEIRILNPEIKNIKVEDIQVPSDLKPKS
ncbi:MAG: Protein TolB [Bacteroidia bacterium]|nr:Protein TolB [Bacteroidia bacterium]